MNNPVTQTSKVCRFDWPAHCHGCTMAPTARSTSCNACRVGCNGRCHRSPVCSHGFCASPRRYEGSMSWLVVSAVLPLECQSPWYICHFPSYGFARVRVSSGVLTNGISAKHRHTPFLCLNGHRRRSFLAFRCVSPSPIGACVSIYTVSTSRIVVLYQRQRADVPGVPLIV